MDQATEMLRSSVEEFVAATAAKQPTPGGGSVAGVVAALGTALGEMSLNFTRGKKKYAEHEEFYAHLGGRLEKTRGELPGAYGCSFGSGAALRGLPPVRIAGHGPPDQRTGDAPVWQR